MPSTNNNTSSQGSHRIPRHYRHRRRQSGHGSHARVEGLSQARDPPNDMELSAPRDRVNRVSKGAYGAEIGDPNGDKDGHPEGHPQSGEACA
jgi:hypothetical protein